MRTLSAAIVSILGIACLLALPVMGAEQYLGSVLSDGDGGAFSFNSLNSQTLQADQLDAGAMVLPQGGTVAVQCAAAACYRVGVGISTVAKCGRDVKLAANAVPYQVFVPLGSTAIAFIPVVGSDAGADLCDVYSVTKAPPAF